MRWVCCTVLSNCPDQVLGADGENGDGHSGGDDDRWQSIVSVAGEGDEVDDDNGLPFLTSGDPGSAWICNRFLVQEIAVVVFFCLQLVVVNTERVGVAVVAAVVVVVAVVAAVAVLMAVVVAAGVA